MNIPFPLTRSNYCLQGVSEITSYKKKLEQIQIIVLEKIAFIMMMRFFKVFVGPRLTNNNYARFRLSPYSISASTSLIWLGLS